MRHLCGSAVPDALPGERLFAFTDGVYEVLDRHEREWGLEGISEAIVATRGFTPGEALDAILDRALAHAGGRPLADDATVLVVDRLAG